MTTEMFDLLYLIDSLLTILLKTGLLLALLMYCGSGLKIKEMKK